MNLSRTTLLLDWHGVLSTSMFFEHWKSSTHPLYKKFFEIQQLWFGGMKDTIDEWMRGSMTSEDFIEQLAKRVNLDDALLMEEFVLSCCSMQLSSPEIPFILQSLRNSGIKVFITTDNMDSFHRWTVPSMHLDEFTDGIFSSSEVGCVKTHTDTNGRSLFFQQCLTSLNIPFQSCVLMDDSISVKNAVQTLGINFCLIPSAQELPLILTSF